MSEFFYAYPHYPGHPRFIQLTYAREYFRKNNLRLIGVTRKRIVGNTSEVVFYGEPCGS